MRVPTNHPAYLRLLRPHLPVASGSRRCMGSATAAATKLPDKSGNPRKKLSKQERKSLVLDYVQQYRAMNGGKYPTVKETKKEVGGCYYVVRSIIQELQYNENSTTEVDKKATIGKAADVSGDVLVGEVSVSFDSDGLVEGGKCEDSVVSEVNEVIEGELLVEEEVLVSAVDKVIDGGPEEEPKSEGRGTEVEEVSDSSALVDNVDDDCLNPTEEGLGSLSRFDGMIEVERGNTPASDEGSGISSEDVNGSQGGSLAQEKDTELAAQNVFSGEPLVRSDLQKVSEDTGDSKRSLKSSEVLKTRDLEEKSTSKVDELPSKPVDSSEYELKKPTREVIQKSEEESSLWGNLKSLASNFISIWRR